nr:hypothetical protein BaRGS_000272 [Batillaria attramentaria]
MRGYEVFRQDREDRHKGGIATLVKTSIPAVEVHRSGKEELEHHTVKLLLPSGDLLITNCYSPPASVLGLHNVKLEASRHLVVGDFNSHSPSWGYEELDSRGEEVEDWMMENQIVLINKPDDKPTSYSRAWKTSSTPDLAIATDDIHRLSTRAVSTQLGGSDHLPVTITISSIGCTEHNMAPSWNLKRAKWTTFREKADHLCKDISQSQHLNKNVQLFSDAVLQAAKVSIPRGKRRQYRPYWSDHLAQLHTELDSARETMEDNPITENVQRHNAIKETFNQQKRTEIQRSWNEKTSSLNMEKDTGKLWNLTKTLNEDVAPKYSRTVIEEEGMHHTGKKAANILADFYKEGSTTTLPSARVQEVHKEIKEKLKHQDPSQSMTSAFTMAELNTAIRTLKTKKAPAYRKNRSTEDQLVYLAQELEDAFQEKKKVLAVFVDLTKAFDKVWKPGLLLKLLNRKVEGKMYRWIQDFLQYRTARVKLDGGSMSHRVTLPNGVPQGGVVSPTLFLIFIDDIAEKMTKHVSRALHADDFAAWNASEHLSSATIRMQEAVDHIGRWASDWGVEINATKTVTTVFSLSTLPETAKLKMNGKELEQEDTPTYLGVKLDKRLTWNPHLKDIERKATRKLAIMKKLAGTTWGANSNILQRVYTGTVRPNLEYGSSAWATASKTNTSRLSKVQNAGLRLITGGMKTTPVQAMEKHTGLQSLDDRREEKVYVHSEKLLRMPNHPMHEKLKNPTKNRLKRTSFNHLSKALHNRTKDLLPASPTSIEMLPDFEEPNDHLEGVSIITSVPGIQTKDSQASPLLKALALEMIDEQYNPSEWTHVFTDGSSEGAVKNGGAGIFIRHTDGRLTPRAFPTGRISSNYRAESTALLHAARALSKSDNPPPKIVFFTDCKSLLQGLQNPKSEQLLNTIKKTLQDLSRRSTITLQWIPSHCGIIGNEKADALSKAGSKMQQFNHPVTYREAKIIIHNNFRTQWKRRLGVDDSIDPIH